MLQNCVCRLQIHTLADCFECSFHRPGFIRLHCIADSLYLSRLFWFVVFIILLFLLCIMYDYYYHHLPYKNAGKHFVPPENAIEKERMHKHILGFNSPCACRHKFSAKVYFETARAMKRRHKRRNGNGVGNDSMPLTRINVLQICSTFCCSTPCACFCFTFNQLNISS